MRSRLVRPSSLTCLSVRVRARAAWFKAADEDSSGALEVDELQDFLAKILHIPMPERMVVMLMKQAGVMENKCEWPRRRSATATAAHTHDGLRIAAWRWLQLAGWRSRAAGPALFD
jgi:hypothetical protein